MMSDMVCAELSAPGIPSKLAEQQKLVLPHPQHGKHSLSISNGFSSSRDAVFAAELPQCLSSKC